MRYIKPNDDTEFISVFFIKTRYRAVVRSFYGRGSGSCDVSKDEESEGEGKGQEKGRAEERRRAGIRKQAEE